MATAVERRGYTAKRGSEYAPKREGAYSAEKERRNQRAQAAFRALYSQLTEGMRDPKEIRRLTKEIYENDPSKFEGGLETIYESESIHGNTYQKDREIYDVMLSAIPNGDLETIKLFKKTFRKIHEPKRGLVYRIAALYSMVLGALLVLNGGSGITGFVVFGEVGSVASSIFGLIFFVVGLMMLMMMQEEFGEEAEHIRNKEGRMITIIRTDHFRKAARRHNPEEIRKALEKLGTGVGREEKLKYLPGYSIRASKGARIRFDKRRDGTYILNDYEPSHQYD